MSVSLSDLLDRNHHFLLRKTLVSGQSIYLLVTVFPVENCHFCLCASRSSGSRNYLVLVNQQQHMYCPHLPLKSAEWDGGWQGPWGWRNCWHWRWACITYLTSRSVGSTGQCSMSEHRPIPLAWRLLYRLYIRLSRMWRGPQQERRKKVTPMFFHSSPHVQDGLWLVLL